MKRYFIKGTDKEIKEGEYVKLNRRFKDGNINITCVLSESLAGMLADKGYIDIREEDSVPVADPAQSLSDLANALFLKNEKLEKQIAELQKAVGRQNNIINRRLAAIEARLGNVK